MKNLLEFICVYILGKLNIQRLNRLTIQDKEVRIGISKFVPDDGKWHGVEVKTMFWLKVGKNRKRVFYDDISVFIDGKSKSKRRIK